MDNGAWAYTQYFDVSHDSWHSVSPLHETVVDLLYDDIRPDVLYLSLIQRISRQLEQSFTHKASIRMIVQVI